MEGVYLFNEIYNYNTKETSQQVYSHADDQKGHRLVDWLQKFQNYIIYRVNQVDAARRQVYSPAGCQEGYSHADDQKGHRLVDWLQKFQKYISYRVN